MLATRHIRRLQVANILQNRHLQHHPQLLAALNSSPGRLTHLIFNKFDEYKVIIESEPLLFSQLQHIGSIPYSSQRNMVNFVATHLSVLKLLPNLTSLDAKGGRDGKEWTHEGLTYLTKLNHKLSRFLVHSYGSRCIVWKRQGWTWERQEVARFTPWDIIRGHCDQV